MRVRLKKDGRKVKLWGLDKLHKDVVKDIILKIPHREAIISNLGDGIENLKFIKYGDIDPESIEYEPDKKIKGEQ
jgi:hypothetical protein